MQSVQNISFKAYVPVTYYAKNPATNKYVPVTKEENIRKCQSFVVRNLNGTAKNMKNDKFVEFYKSFDSDYAKVPKVRSVYDKDYPQVFMVTGRDVDFVDEMAKPVGKAKGDAMDRLGHSKSFEAANATRSYFREVKDFLKYRCPRLKNDEGQKLSLRLYFDPKYNKKGDLKGFDFVNAGFTAEKS